MARARGQGAYEINGPYLEWAGTFIGGVQVLFWLEFGPQSLHHWRACHRVLAIPKQPVPKVQPLCALVELIGAAEEEGLMQFLQPPLALKPARDEHQGAPLFPPEHHLLGAVDGHKACG